MLIQHGGPMKQPTIAIVASLAFCSAALAQGAQDMAEKLVSVGSVVGADGPQWLPDGSRVLFPSSKGGGLAIWSVSPSGGEATRLTEPISAQIPRLSPPGDRIAYLSDKGGSPELWLWSLADKRDAQLTRLGARINALSWAPDG